MSGYEIRRANVDDLPQLMQLWRAAQIPVEPLEKRLTEFQVAAAPDGTLVGAIGLHISQHEGCVHGETFSDFGLSDMLRPLLWERLERVAMNHGLFRLWTQEPAPFWKQAGFEPAKPEVISKRPTVFAHNDRLEWMVAQLKDLEAAPVNLDKEFERFKESERAQAEQLRSRAKMLKVVATILSIVLAAFSLYVLFRFAFHRPTGANTAPPPSRTTP